MKRGYASLQNRVKAAFIDSLVLIGMMFLFSELLSLFEEVPNFIRISIFVLIFVLYDPILTSAYGGTIGHSKIGISVRSEQNPDKNIKFPNALIRFIFKALLGWISLLTITGNEKMNLA